MHQMSKNKCWKPSVGKINLPYVQRSVAKGRIYYRYRRDGQLISLPSDVTSAEFAESYKRIHTNFEERAKLEPQDMFNIILPGSIAALIESFKKSSEYNDLKPRVRQLYLHNLDMIAEKLGKFQVTSLTRRVVLEWRDSMSIHPAKANNLIKTISRLYSFGIDRGVIKHSPLTNIRKLKIGEWRPWKQEEIDIFREKAPAPMVLALNLALYTGQRLGDVISMRWNQILDRGIEVTQQKTGEHVWIPIHQTLNVELQKTKKKNAADLNKLKKENIVEFNKVKEQKDNTILVAPGGKAYQATHLKHKFKEAVRDAGLSEELVFHGLRKTAAMMLAEAGCTTQQIKAITGHRTDQMASYYSKAADQKLLARAAISKFEKKYVLKS